MGMTMQTIEFQMLAWSTLLLMLGWLPGSAAKRRAWGMRWLVSNRETEGLPPLTGWGGRAVRAHENLKENYPAFAVAVLLLLVAGAQGERATEIAAIVFLAARLVHMGAYLAGNFWIRTTAWATGWVATLVILLQVVG